MRPPSSVVTFLTTLIFIGAINPCLSQSNHAYTLDSNVSTRVEPKVAVRNTINIGSVDYRVMINDSISINTYDSLSMFKSGVVSAYIHGDSICIWGFFGRMGTFGFQISFFQDSCQVNYVVWDDFPKYKMKPNDSLHDNLLVPCKNYTLTISRKPTFKSDQNIGGIVDFETADFFYRPSGGRDRKISVKLTGYFRTGHIKTNQEILSGYKRYKTLINW